MLNPWENENIKQDSISIFHFILYIYNRRNCSCISNEFTTKVMLARFKTFLRCRWYDLKRHISFYFYLDIWLFLYEKKKNYIPIIIGYYYTSPEICPYKSNTLDWHVIPWDKMKNITWLCKWEGGAYYTRVIRVDKESEAHWLCSGMRIAYNSMCEQTTGIFSR